MTIYKPKGSPLSVFSHLLVLSTLHTSSSSIPTHEPEKIPHPDPWTWKGCTVQSERLFKSHHPGPIIVVDKWEIVISCCYWLSRRTLARCALFQATKKFQSVSLQNLHPKMYRAGTFCCNSWACSNKACGLATEQCLINLKYSAELFQSYCIRYKHC